MTTFVALLRAVNVGGRNRIPMAELREELSAAGLADVQTYVQSGNVVFRTDSDDPAEQAAALHDAISRGFGCDVQVLVLTHAELTRVSAGNPFVVVGADEMYLHATFLFAPVAEAAFAGLELPAQEGELAALAGDEGGLGGRVVYLHLPHGYGRSKLGNAWFERALKTPATTRNWRTVLALAELGAG
jgi:uncharacterized protein (DUF1697 family)